MSCLPCISLSILVAIRAETNSTETQPKQTFVRGSFYCRGRTWRNAMKFSSASTEERLSHVHLAPVIRDFRWDVTASYRLLGRYVDCPPCRHQAAERVSREVWGARGMPQL